MLLVARETPVDIISIDLLADIDFVCFNRKSLIFLPKTITDTHKKFNPFPCYCSNHLIVDAVYIR